MLNLPMKLVNKNKIISIKGEIKCQLKQKPLTEK
jgi:hypothetical protein